MAAGLVVKAINNYYYVNIQGKILEATLRGRLKRKGLVYVGDSVVITYTGEGSGVIEEVLPRKSLLQRPLVANVELAVLVFALREPNYHFRVIDRFTVLAEQAGVGIQLCFNKSELADEEEQNEIFEYYKNVGYPPLMISAKQERGIEELHQLIEGKLCVFAGPSGVGKSSILNLLCPGANLKVGCLSEKIKRGKHTTRYVELLPIGEGGWVADTPGFSSLQMNQIAKEDLGYYFPEMVPYISQCKLPSCLHLHEPNCGVKLALEKKKIEKQRYDNYLLFLQEIMEEERKKYD